MIEIKINIEGFKKIYKKLIVVGQKIISILFKITQMSIYLIRVNELST